MKTIIRSSLILVFSIMLSTTSQAQKKSAAFKRYAEGNMPYEVKNPFFTKFVFFETVGLGYNANPKNDPSIMHKVQLMKKPKPGISLRLKNHHQDLQVAHLMRHNIAGFQTNTTFRDPTSPIKIGDTYHIWYTKTWGTPPVGQAKGSQDAWQDSKKDWKRIYTWDFASIWHATSKDGFHWKEEGIALEPGPKGSYDDRCVFTPDVLVANGKYYLYYQVAQSPHVYRDGPHKIAMAWADNPNGPWTKSEAPVLEPSKEGFDSRKVHDPSIIVKGGKYWMYYKGDGNHDKQIQYGKFFPIGWGVAIADKPEGPFKKSKHNPVVVGGHEVMIFPYKSGVCGLVRQGPELFTLQYAEDGLNFEVKSHIKHVPHAGNFFRKGHFKDIDKYPAAFPKWGLAHDYVLGNPEAHIIRFEVDFKNKSMH